MKELTNIQQGLNAPKDQYNNFGKYAYRSCEGILSALKPLLSKNKCSLVIQDEMVEVGGRVYVKSTATITCGEAKESATAYAREPETKKGMDDAQVTGATSSYARKYALNGLFCIDDNKDPDATNRHDEQPNYINESQVADINAMIDELKIDKAAFLKYLGADSVETIPASKFDSACAAIQMKRDQQEGGK